MNVPTDSPGSDVFAKVSRILSQPVGFPWTRLRKELRTIALPFVLAALVPALFAFLVRAGWIERLLFTVNGRTSGTSLLELSLAIVMIRHALLNLGGSALFAEEFERGTLPGFLAQPESRLLLWAPKFVALGGCLIAILLLDLLWAPFAHRVIPAALDGHYKARIGEREAYLLELFALEGMLFAWTIVMVPTATLVFRNAYIGFVASAGAPFVYFFVGAWVAMQWERWTGRYLVGLPFGIRERPQTLLFWGQIPVLLLALAVCVRCIRRLEV